jgi:hypothetical protein
MVIPSSAVKAESNYITASGASLPLNGRPFQYRGLNTGREGVRWGDNGWLTAQMDTHFPRLPRGGMTRILAVQDSGTPVVSQIATEATQNT